MVLEMSGASRFRHLCALLASVVVASATTACGGATKPAGSSSRTVDIVVTPARCIAEPTSVAPGVVGFSVTDKGASSVTEVELHQPDGYLLAEQSNLSGAFHGKFSATLSDGIYEIYCPGAASTVTNLTVSGAVSGKSWKQYPQLVQAVASFTQWVPTQMATLVSATSAFVSAVDSGNLAQAEQLYGLAREAFETIEPETDSFANLYLDIDGQIESFGNPTQFEGFHELEEAMWVGGSLEGQGGYAQDLLANIKQLQTLLAPVTYQPAQIVDFAYSELTEASSYVITGAEERYSNLELVDLKGAYYGAAEALAVLGPSLGRLEPAVLHGWDSAQSALWGALSQSTQTPGAAGSGFESYTQVDLVHRQHLYDAIANLVTALSRAAAVLP